MAKQKTSLTKNPFLSPLWRINNLYKIIDKQGKPVVFKLNWAQEALYNDMWYCNVVLKARQLGISTFICLLFLDRCLFNSNKSAGIIAHTLEDSQHMFRRVKYAYDNLPPEIKEIITCDNDTSQMLKFSNGSSLRVGTSLRSSTFQYLHISEFGKICAKYPDKAEEIITGSLNTVAAGQFVFIESTAEGREGYFFDICKQAQGRNAADLSKLDFKFHFFPWHGDPDYRIGNCLPFTQEQLDYFEHLKGIGVVLDDQQKNWYVARERIQGDNMRREYPSSATEAWEQSNEGRYYGKLITQSRIEGRIGNVPYDDSLPVYTAWDLGYNDSTAIWYYQVYRKEVRLIDYDEGGDSLQFWLGIIKKKPYVYEKHLGPHDLNVHEYSTGLTRQAFARRMGINLIPVPKTGIMEGIDCARAMFNRCWFDEAKCAKGIKALDNYKKDWNDKTGTWRSDPCHNWASHGADAFRTLATGLNIVEQPKLVTSHNPAQYVNNRFTSRF